MRARQILEASIPLGKPVEAKGFTFGFEAEFIISEGYIYEAATRDIDEFASDGGVKLLDDYFSMPGLDDALYRWQEEHPDDDAEDMLSHLGAQEFLKQVDAEVNNHEARYDPETGQFSVHDKSQYDAFYDLSGRLSEDLGINPIPFSDDHARAKEPDQWYLEPDMTVQGDDPMDYDAELTTPVFDDYQDFVSELQSVLAWIGQHESDWVYTNGTCGLHINIGPPKTFDPIKFIVFSGEEWLARLFPRSNNSSTQPVAKELRDKATFARSFDGFIKRLRGQAKKIDDKMFLVNFLPWFEGKRYVEIRAMGGQGYEKRFAEIKQHVDRLVTLFAIASNPQKYRQAYMQKVYRYFIAAEPDALQSPQQTMAARMFLRYARANKIPDWQVERWLSNGRIVATPLQVFEWVAMMIANKQQVPSALLKLICREIGLNRSDVDHLPEQLPRYSRDEHATAIAATVQQLKAYAG
jgi:hypothetical protein